MKTAKTISTVALLSLALVLATMLVACSSSSFSQEILENDTGGLYLKITAENASGNSATTTGALQVAEGDIVVISPDLTKGAIHVTITSSDGKIVAYDDDAKGRVLFTIEAEPGMYDVKTKGANGATGSMTIFAERSTELEAQDAALAETLAQNGVDPSAVSRSAQSKK